MNYLLYILWIKKRLSAEQKALYREIVNVMINKDDIFDVCRLHNLWDWVRSNTDIEIFRWFHCVKYRDITPETKKLLEKMLLKPLE